MKTKVLTRILFFAILYVIFTGSVLFSQDTYKVKRVIDGDTIELENGDRVRLIGIDTPETVHPSKAVEYYGKEASDFTKRMVEGKRVKIEFDLQKRDKYGRLLAYVFLEDGTFLNAELLKQGYANISTYPPNVKYVEEFSRLEREARENVRGLWAPSDSQKVVTSSQRTPTEDDEIVYITKTGKKYHRADCRYLSKSKIPISLKDAVLSYTPCSVCNPPTIQVVRPIQKKTESVTVYVTRTGSKYHRAGCRYLKKSSIPMSLEEAKKRYSPCSVCNPPR